MKRIIKTLSAVLASVIAYANLGASKVMALTIRDGVEAVKTDEMPSTLIGNGGVINNITSVAFYAIGAITVIMLIIGGVKYATSAGDAKAVTDAKNTILYALIGLVIVILSYAIVNFVLGIVK